MNGVAREDHGEQGPEQRRDGEAGDADVSDLGFVGETKPVRPASVPIHAKIVHRQEWTRAILALSLTGLMAAILLIALLRTDGWEEMKELLDLAVPAVTGLLGSAIGFYFGSKA